MKQYSRVTYAQRCQIAALLQTNLSVFAISTQLGFHKSTIYREIKRNSWSTKYMADFAHKCAMNRALKRIKPLLIQGSLQCFVGAKLKLGWSPQQIAGRYKKEIKKSLSHQSIYRFIVRSGQYRECLKFFTKRGCGRVHQRRLRQETLNSIHDRPLSATNRSRFGHWERDGMFGSNKKQILVCLERKSRFVRLVQMPTTKAHEVSQLTEKLLSKEKVLTITNDNGTEFRKPQTCKYPIYYCDPMKPNQRGSIENTIGKLRRFIKRTTNLDLLGANGIKKIENNLNHIPRKIFNYQTPYEVYYKKKVALAM